MKASIIGGGLAGSEAALCLARMGVEVTLFEMRPAVPTPVHRSGDLAELVCSNSLKSTKPDSAAGMLKEELHLLGSPLYQAALSQRIPAGGALAVDRHGFAGCVTKRIEDEPLITVVRKEVASLKDVCPADAIIVATGPLTSDALSAHLLESLGEGELAFFDAAAPIVMADSLDFDVLFRQSRYDGASEGDYLNAPLDKGEYEAFIDALLAAERVIRKDFETKELFQACQPIEEVARAGRDAPRFGALKPVGLTDPRSGRRPYAVVQLRQEDTARTSYNLVGFQTNLTFRAQAEVFRMIPGLEHAEFARYGVMHRNTFLNAPQLIDVSGRLKLDDPSVDAPVFVAGQLAGTEGYCEAIRSGLHCAISAYANGCGLGIEPPPATTVFGALQSHATDSQVIDYQPMHVNFGIMPPLDAPVRNKRKRYEAYAQRGRDALVRYRDHLLSAGAWKVK